MFCTVEKSCHSTPFPFSMDLNLDLKYMHNEGVEVQLLFDIKRKAYAVLIIH